MNANGSASNASVWLSLLSGAIVGALITALATHRLDKDARREAAHGPLKHWWPC